MSRRVERRTIVGAHAGLVLSHCAELLVHLERISVLVVTVASARLSVLEGGNVRLANELQH